MINHITRIGVLGGALAVVIFCLAALALTADAQAAVPDLSFSKSATDSVPGGQVSYTLAVTNSGGAASNSQTIQDDLPAGFEWLIGASNIDCSLDTEDGVQVLHCEGFVVEPRHATPTDYVNGLAYVTVVAEANECGTWPNTALLRDDATGAVTSSTVAFLDVTCPTPVPTATPTSPPATATPIPATVTPVSTFPSEPSVIVVTATPTKTPIRNVPLPPNTGSGPSSQEGEGGGLMYGILGLLGLCFGIAAWSVWSRR